MGGGNQLAFFWFPNGRAGMKGEQYPGAPWKTLPSGTMHHIAFAVESVEELERAREELTGRGITVTEVWDHEFCKSIYFQDPDGLQLELSAWVRPLNERDVDQKYLRPTEEREPAAVGD